MIRSQLSKFLLPFGICLSILGCVLMFWVASLGAVQVNIGANPWSPDGNSLVFEWSGKLYILDIKTQALRQISNTLGNYREANWSPIDNRIAYMANKSGKFALCLTESTIHKETCPITSPSGDIFFPHWSPDGKRLGFYESTNLQSSPNEQGYGSLVISESGDKFYLQSSVVSLGNISMTDDLQWSPDSRHIAFVGFSTDLPRNIYIIDVNGTKLHRLTQSRYDTYPVWSPDGRQIAFYSERDTQQNWSGAIYVQDVENVDAKRLSSTIDRVNRMQWSPNGNLIAFSTYNPENNDAEIFLMKSDGSDAKSIANNVNIGSFLSWSPNSHFLAFQVAQYLAIIDVNANQVQFLYYPQKFADWLALESASKIAAPLLAIGILSILGCVIDIANAAFRNRR